jgi:hypothetical protein
MDEPIVFPQSFIDTMSERIRRHIERQIVYGDMSDWFGPVRHRGLSSVNTGARWGPAMNTEQFAANLYLNSWRFLCPTNILKTHSP